MALFDFIMSQRKRKIIKTFYADYPETPYISDTRPGGWFEKAKAFPNQSIVNKTMMERYSDGLLPGHIYMLYWLKKYTNKKVPAYFEYKYGIEFDKEKAFLLECGYLNGSDKPTVKGDDAIKLHIEVINNHSTKADRSIEGISKQTLAQRDNMRRNGFKEYVFIANRNSCEICAALNGEHFRLSKLKIGVNAPPMHDGCSCSIAAYEDEEEYNAWLNSL